MKKIQVLILFIAITNCSSDLAASTEDEIPEKTFNYVPTTVADIELLQQILQKGGEVNINSDTGENIIFPKGYKIKWSGHGTLNIMSGKNIIFEEGATVKNVGSGTLCLSNFNIEMYTKSVVRQRGRQFEECKTVKEGEIVFKDTTPQIDFSESEGNITFYYNPTFSTDSTKCKYENPHCFDNNVIQGNCYFKAFMLVWGEKDFEDIEKNLEGNYILGSYHTLLTKPNYNFLQSFRGLLNLNQANIVTKSYTRNKEDIFYPFLSANQLLFTSYYDNKTTQKSRQAQQLVKNRDDPGNLRENNSDPHSLFYSHVKFFHLFGKKEDTILHIAAQYQRPNCLKYILNVLLSINDPADKFEREYVRRFVNRENSLGERAIDIAVKSGNKQLLQVFVEELSKVGLSPDKERLRVLVHQQKQNYEEVEIQLAGLNDPPEELDKLYQGFSQKDSGIEKDNLWAFEANRRFFGIESSSQRINTLCRKFTESYRQAPPVLPQLSIDGVSSRSRIILLRNISKEKLSKLFPTMNLNYWTSKPTSEDSNDKCKYIDKFPVTFFFGGLVHTLISRPFPDSGKKGFVYYEEIGAYHKEGSKPSTMQQLNNISQRLNESKIAKLCRISRNSGTAIKPEDLSDYGYKGTFAKEDAEYLNRMNLLLDLEVSSRLTDDGSSEFDKLPVGVAIARMFFLIEKGNKTFNDFLNTSSDYHCFTNPDTTSSSNAEPRKRAIKRVCEDFHECRKNLKIMNGCKKVVEWQSSHLYGYVISTPEGIHQELIDQYGGGYESAGEEYKLQ